MLHTPRFSDPRQELLMEALQDRARLAMRISYIVLLNLTLEDF